MRLFETELTGVRRVEAEVHVDSRGDLRELYRDGHLDLEVAQLNLSRSVPGALRGLHWQLEPAQGKLVWVTRGRIFDVAVDLRPDSDSFGRHLGLELAPGAGVWIPTGFAHGFLALTEAEVMYAMSAPYRQDRQRGVRWNDPDLAIRWPLAGAAPLLSPRDAALPRLGDLDDADLPDRG